MISFSQSFSRFFSSFSVINPLNFYRFTTLSRFYSILAHKFYNTLRLASPSFTKHSVSKRLFDIESKEGFTSGAPLDGFNSLFKFRLHSIFNKKLVLISNKTNVYKEIDIYNLSVQKDESYITNLAIVHNCRCTVEQLSDGDVTDLHGFIPPDDVPPEFMMNSGKDGYIFKEKGKGKHPYFDVAKGDKELAKRNFNLPIITHG